MDFDFETSCSASSSSLDVTVLTSCFLVSFRSAVLSCDVRLPFGLPLFPVFFGTDSSGSADARCSLDFGRVSGFAVGFEDAALGLPLPRLVGGSAAGWAANCVASSASSPLRSADLAGAFRFGIVGVKLTRWRERVASENSRAGHVTHRPTATFRHGLGRDARLYLTPVFSRSI